MPKTTILCYGEIEKPKTSTENVLGPFVDDGAPYSVIGDIELIVIMKEHGMGCYNRTNEIPNGLKGNTHLQYGNRSHASPPRRIIESLDITAASNLKEPVVITHIIIQVSSEWVIRKHVTCRANIER